MDMPWFLLLAGVVTVFTLGRWGREAVAHRRRISRVPIRVHVNGIRGKSTVARIIAGMLREAGYATVGKSTGTFAAVINPEGEDVPIVRKGPATILEQIEVAKQWLDGMDAWVVECMALKPAYQAISEKEIVRSTIGVITNVREDHQDVMGETLPEIARSLLSTCPVNGVLLTAEQNPEIVEIMQQVAKSQGTRLILTDPEWVTDDDIARFDYISFKENVAIALAVAELIGIERSVAMTGMVKAPPDPGVLRLKHLTIGDKKVTWANLFAVNDRESMIAVMPKLEPWITADTTTVGILNNRSDRERRATQFADIAAKDLDFDRLVTFGAYETRVTDRLKTNGYPAGQIINLGEERSPSVDEIIQKMVHDQPTGHVMVVGFVNIHTHQAELMLEYFEQLDPATVTNA